MEQKRKENIKEVVMEIFLVALVVFDLKRGERKKSIMQPVTILDLINRKKKNFNFFTRRPIY